MKREFKDRKGPAQSSGPFFKPSVQAKLAVGQPGDQFEKEADSVADKVVNKTGDAGVQKAEAPGEEEKVQQKPLAQSISSVQKKDLTGKENPVQKAEAPAEEEKVQKAESPAEEEKVQKAEAPAEEEAAVQKAEAPADEEKVQKAEAPMEEEPVQKAAAPEEEQPVQKAEAPAEEEKVQKAEAPAEEEPVQKAEAAPEEKKDESVQKADEEEKKPVQQKSSGASGTTTEAKLASAKGKGSAMSGGLKQQMESGFGADFSGVRIHNDSQAEQLSSDMGAQAFTHGNDIYFNKGKFNPESKEGQHLIAHELTHTIQQDAEGTIRQKSKKLKDHEHGFLNVKNESTDQVYPLSYNAEVDYEKASGGREYFTAQEWPHRNEKSSVKGADRFTTGKYDGPATVKFYKSKNKLVFGNGIVVKAHSLASSPVPTGSYPLMLPDYPHIYGYLEDSDFSYAWFRIGEDSSRYLHIGNITAGCITIGAEQTGTPGDRKKWTSIYRYLINCRAGNNKSVGTIHVYD